MSRKQRYRNDAEYRARVNKENRERHQRKMKSNPDYVILCRIRARISNARISIEHHERRLAYFHTRIEKDVRKLMKMGYLK